MSVDPWPEKAADIAWLEALKLAFEDLPLVNARIDRLLAIARSGEGETKDDSVGCAEKLVGRYIYTLIEARMSAKAGTPEGRELSYLAALVSDVEEYGAHELSPGELNDPSPHFQALASPVPLPEGWVLVPREPTVDMCGAPFDATVEMPESPAVRLSLDASNEAVAAFYRAMIAAAPPPSIKASSGEG